MPPQTKRRPKDTSWEDIIADMITDYQSSAKNTSEIKTWYFFAPMIVKAIMVPIIGIIVYVL